jgi:AcrR family transcriptional regulator
MQSEVPTFEKPVGQPATRGRPREFCPQTALTAALKVFWQRGYEAASMAELTEAMGITKPSLYACFGNKEALFRKALDLYQREKLAYVGHALNAPSAKGVAEAFLRSSLEMACNKNDPRGCLQVISAVACTTYAESLRDEIIGLRKATEQALLDRFNRAKAEGDFPAGVEPAPMATYLFTLLQGMSLQAQSGANEDCLAQFVETALAIWPGK